MSSEVNECFRNIDAVHDQAALSECTRVTPRSAPDIEHPHSRFEVEHLNQRIALLTGALRERIAQVCRTEVIGDRLEPVATRHC